MSMSDPIADMLTRIRNGLHAHKSTVSMPASNVKSAIAAVLKQEGYITDYAVQGAAVKRNLQVVLKYFQDKPVIDELKRISTPGCRVYASRSNLPLVKNGLGIALISTSKGIMSNKAARQQGVGGEVICTVF